VVVMTEALAPEENGVHGGAAVDDHGDQKADSSIMPGHGVSLAVGGEGLKVKK
jgi:hypothetical protein